jgi:iron complex transport system substrate-binding protein
MKRRYVTIAAIVIIALIASSAVIVYYQGQAAEKTKTLANLVDDYGYVTSLSDYAKRIVSLAPSCTEILFALHLDDKVVAVTDYDNYPYNFSAWVAAGNMTSVGSFSNPNTEVIASVEPDLIIATAGVQGETADKLRGLNYKVLVLNPTTVEGILQDIMLVGKATGYTTQATTLVDSLRSRIEAVENKVASTTATTKVYYEEWYDPTSLWSAGAKTWQNDAIAKAGGTNIFADQQLADFQSSAEAVISLNPDVILLPSQMGTGAPFWGSISDVKARPGWNSISAVQNDQIYQINGDIIARAGPRVADVIEAMARAFHPELF